MCDNIKVYYFLKKIQTVLFYLFIYFCKEIPIPFLSKQIFLIDSDRPHVLLGL